MSLGALSKCQFGFISINCGLPPRFFLSLFVKMESSLVKVVFCRVGTNTYRHSHEILASQNCIEKWQITHYGLYSEMYASLFSK